MMNHQGGTSHSNCNANTQNKFNHQSTGPPEFLPSASSLAAAGYQMFPDEVLGSSHAISSIGFNASVAPQNADSGAEYVGNNRYNNLNMSLTLGLPSYGPENQNTCNSCAVIDNGGSSSTVQEPGSNSSSMNMRCLSCKRKSPEHTVQELVIGESSSAAVHTGTSKRQVSEVYGGIDLNISTPCTSPISHQDQSETTIGHDTTRPVSDMQIFNGARISENFQSNIHRHTAANQQAFRPTSILSSGNYMRNAHIQLPSQQSLYGQVNHSPFFRSEESYNSPISSVQPDGHVPNFYETSQAPPWSHMMRPSTGFSSLFPVYTVAESVPVAPFHYARNIMLSPLIGRRNWAHDARNSHFVNETANFRGNFFCPLHGFVHDTTHSAHAPVSFSGFNFADCYTLVTPRGANYPVPPPTSIPWHRYSAAEAVAQELGFVVEPGNGVSQNQHTSGAGYDNNAASYYTWSLANAQVSMGLVPEDLNTSEARFANEDIYQLYHIFWSPDNAQNRRRLSLEIHHRLTLLHSIDPSRPVIVPPELRMLDYSVLMDIVTGQIQNHEEDEEQYESDNWAFEVNAEDAGGPEAEEGLSEEMVVNLLNLEKFQPIPDESEESECCCICQEEYQEDENLGKLWCGHRFHACCIKPWLERKNVCPICKQIAIPLYDDSP